MEVVTMINRWLYPLSVLLIAGSLLSSCALPVKPQAEAELSVQKIQEALSTQTAANQDLERKIASLQLLLLERDAKTKDLNRKIEEAILEVVRAKAKLRSVESKAEAVSTLAEGEIALKSLRANGGVETDTDFLQAEELLKASGLELKKENYGGALYLATQAKSIITEDRERSSGRDQTPLLAGEVAFATPLPLRLVSTGKIREGPGLDSKVLVTLREGAELVGYSYKGLWVRVRTEDSRGGWIYYSLIGGR